ncbi:MAG: hypothetical protein AB7I30_14235 [Isosphaeraceae bacterium]
MDRRHMLGMLGAGAVGTLAMGGTHARAADHHDDAHMETMARCARKCADAAAHCLGQLRKGSGDSERHAAALAMTIACETFCLHTYHQAACHSPLAALAHEANAKACEQCAKTCEGMDGAVMKECVEECRKCAEACREMARHTDHGRSSR